MPRGPQYTDEELLEDIRHLASRLGRVPKKRDMNEHGDHGAKTYQDRWGSWSSAVEAAGFEPHSKGTGYRVRPDACPLCGSEQSGLDFHHWRYGNNELGCYLCRRCHDVIHRGDAEAKTPGWLVACVENLIDRHLEYHNDIQEVDAILSRYNLPDIGDLIAKELDEKTSGE